VDPRTGVTAENAAASEDNDDSSSTLAVIGIVLGALGLAVAIYAMVTGRRRGCGLITGRWVVETVWVVEIVCVVAAEPPGSGPRGHDAEAG
jgi:hypothetical protein